MKKIADNFFDGNEESSRINRIILEKAPFGIYVIDNKGNIEYVNPAMMKISGDTYEQFCSLNVFELPTYRKMGLADKFKTALNGRSFTLNAVRYTSHFARKTTIRNFVGIPIKEDGKRKVLAFIEDITELKKAEEKLYKINDELESTVDKRTSELKDVNEQLRLEIIEHKRAEEERLTHIKYLTSLERIDKIINQEKDLERMMRDVIKTVFLIFDCDRAWLLYPCEPDIQFWGVPYEYTRPEYPGAHAFKMVIPMTQDIKGIIEEALATEFPVIYGKSFEKPIPESISSRFSVQSQMVMAIHPKLGRSWMVGMHQCSYERVWTENEQKLFGDISHRITDALSNLLFYRNTQKSEKRFQDVVENASEWVWEVDPDGKYVYSSSVIEKILGYKPEEVLEKHFYDFFFPEDREKLKKGAFEIFAQKQPIREFINRNIHRDGKTVWLLTSGVPVLDENGSLTGYRGLDVDITRRKQAEDALLELNRTLEQHVKNRTAELEAANRELEAFSYSVSHDLRAPLRGIDGFSKILLEDCSDKLDDNGRDYLGRICRGTQKMGVLIDDMLKLSRITRQEMRIVEINMTAAAKNIVDGIKELETAREIEFVIEDDLYAEGDKRLVGIALEKLFENAVKFTSRETIARIEFGANDVKGKKEFFVKDNGVGFNEKYKDKLFAPFQRLHRQDDYTGTGIGLSIVSRIISKHNGRIRAESKENKGAVFYFTLN